MPDSSDHPTVRFLVSGRVQGVGFRYRCQAQARELGLAGWVQNRDDGQVHGRLQGPEPAIAAMLNWLRSGPTGARVDDLQTEAVDAAAFEGFEIR